MLRGSWGAAAAWMSGFAACAFGLGCGSSASPAIPDPGGPFHTNVPPDTTLGALTIDQAQELCTEFFAADHAYLITAVDTEAACRYGSLGVAEAWSNSRDGGASFDAGGDDGGSVSSVCQSLYDTCERDRANAVGLSCVVPAAGCGATVELFSACLNEIAGSDPVGRCVTTPICGTDAGATAFDASVTPNSCLGLASGEPAMPACDRLERQCPNIGVFDPYLD